MAKRKVIGFEHAVAMELCRREGKKVQVNIAQMKEIVGCLISMIAENRLVLTGLSCAATTREAYGGELKGTEGGKTKVRRVRGRSGSKPGLCGNKLSAKPSLRKGAVPKVRGRKRKVK